MINIIYIETTRTVEFVWLFFCRMERKRPLLQVTVVAAEIGFRGSIEGPSEGGDERGSTTPGYDYEDDEWD